MRRKKGRTTGPAEYPLTRRGTLEAPPGHPALVTASMSVDGPVAIWGSTEGSAALGARTDSTGLATFPVTVPYSAQPVALVAYDQDARPVDVTQVHLGVAHPLVELLSDGSYLVVGARCQWREAGPEQNAVVYDRTGRVVRLGCLGDGIEHLQVARDGTIWVAYFDEGVFGNLGWGNPGPTPLGAGGIAAWDADLVKMWELDPSDGLVADCYTMNVWNSDVVAIPYTDFPIVQIDAGDVTVTSTNLRGPRGIIRSDNRLGVIGTYDKKGLLILGLLIRGEFRETGRAKLVTPEGASLPRLPLHCRGSLAHVFLGAEWLSFDLESVTR